MIFKDAYVRLRDACLETGQIPPTVDQAETIFEMALQQLADDCAMDVRSAYLEKEFSVSLVSGVATFTDTTMLHDFIKRVIYEEGTDDEMVVSLLPDGASRNALKQERNTMFLWAVRQSKALYVATGDPDTPDDGTLTITAPQVPTLGTVGASGVVPRQLQDDLIKAAMGFVGKVAAAA